MKDVLLSCSMTAVMAFVIGFCAGQPSDLQVANYNTLKYKVELIQSYREYYESTESLLDSIYSKDDSFMDVIGETDAYDTYEESKVKVINLNKQEQ